jgi:predicted ester cyclase
MPLGREVRMDNKAVITRLFDEVLNQGNLDLLDEFIGANYVEHDLVSGQLPCVAGIKAKLVVQRQAFPDIRFRLEELIGEGAAVAARSGWEGTHMAEFMGIQPTGNAVRVEAWISTAYKMPGS